MFYPYDTSFSKEGTTLNDLLEVNFTISVNINEIGNTLKDSIVFDEIGDPFEDGMIVFWVLLNFA